MPMRSYTHQQYVEALREMGLDPIGERLGGQKLCLDQVSGLLMSVPWDHDRYPEFLLDDLRSALEKLRDTSSVGSSPSQH